MPIKPRALEPGAVVGKRLWLLGTSGIDRFTSNGGQAASDGFVAFWDIVKMALATSTWIACGLDTRLAPVHRWAHVPLDL